MKKYIEEKNYYWTFDWVLFRELGNTEVKWLLQQVSTTAFDWMFYVNQDMD